MNKSAVSHKIYKFRWITAGAKGEKNIMKYTYTDGTNTVTANNYQEAAEKLYGQHYYHNPGVRDDIEGDISTTYAHVRRGFAEVEVYNIGDKQGTYWGVQAAKPARYILRRI